MSEMLLMPKATAVWLVDNTSLTFEQIATFCRLHPLEVKAIADGENAQGIRGMDPITNGQLSRDELERGQKDPNYRLKVSVSKVVVPTIKRRAPRYTPVSKRQDRPNAIRWLLRNHPELKDSQIIRLVGTTKTTIESIREGSHWNTANLTPMDPVTLGLCTQIALDMEVQKANKGRPQPEQEADSQTLQPASETQMGSDDEYDIRQREDVDAASVFSKFSGKSEDDE